MDIKRYTVHLNSDDGRIRTTAQSAEAAVELILRDQHAPRSAVIKVVPG